MDKLSKIKTTIKLALGIEKDLVRHLDVDDVDDIDDIDDIYKLFFYSFKK